jgi:ferredoxin
MKKVIIEPGCITCGMCEFIAPEVFEVTDICHVKPDADVQKHATAIKCAAKVCPVLVISTEE